MLTQDAIDMLIVDRQATNCSPRTIEFYRTQLGKLQRAYPELPTTPEPIKALIASVQGEPETRHALFRGIRALYLYLVADEVLTHDTNPMRKIRGPRVPKKEQRTLDAGDIASVLAAARSDRDRLLLTVFLDAGIRAGELRNLRGRDLRAGGVLIRGKTGQRHVPLDRSVIGELRDASTGPDVPLFANPQGDPLSLGTIYRIVAGTLRRCGLANGKRGSHMLRHTFGRSYVASGGDLRDLQRIMGHASLNTTGIYVNLSQEELQREHAEHSRLVSSLTLRRVV